MIYLLNQVGVHTIYEADKTKHVHLQEVELSLS